MGRQGTSGWVRLAAVALLAAGVLAGTAVPAGADEGLTVTATSARTASAATDVVLSGTYACGPFTSGVPDRGVIDLTVTQGRGRAATAYGYLEPAVCDGTAQPFTTTLTGVSGRTFHPGPATWSASGYVEGDGGLQHTSVPPTAIRLRR